MPILILVANTFHITAMQMQCHTGCQIPCNTYTYIPQRCRRTDSQDMQNAPERRVHTHQTYPEARLAKEPCKPRPAAHFTHIPVPAHALFARLRPFPHWRG